MTKRWRLFISGWGLILVVVLAVGCVSPHPEDWNNDDWDVEEADGGSPEDEDEAADVIEEPPPLTVATFNVYLLFDTECNSGECGPNDFEIEFSQSEYEARLEEVAAAIEELDADIVLLQELENEGVLEDLAETLDGGYPVAVHGETGFSASLDVAVLARGTFLDTKNYGQRRLTLPDGSRGWFAREFLRVDLDIDGDDVIVFTSHFRSKANGDDPDRRLAEAQEARKIVEEVAEANDDALVVFGGDLNDTPGSEPLEALMSDGGLERVGQNRGTEDIYTYFFNDERMSIDHILWAPTSGGGYVSGSGRSLHHDEPAGFGGSDHGAMIGGFETY